MQEARLTSQSSRLITQVPIYVLSFGLMGVICGVLTGVMDAMQSSGAYVLASATALHTIVGCGVGVLCGFVYALSPRSIQLSQFVDTTQQFLVPPRQMSDYQRGCAVASIWLWAFVMNWIMPSSAALGLNLSARVSTPLFALIIATSMLTLTGITAVPFVAGASRSGGRILASIGSQVRHLTSVVPASMHPILLVLSGLLGLSLVSLAIPPILSLLKSVDNSTLSAVGMLALGVAVAATLRFGAALLTGAKFKTLVSGGLRALRFSHKLTNPLLHLALAIVYSIYHFMSWIVSSPPEWQKMSLHQVTLVTLFFLPLFLGGEYLKPFVKYSKKWGVILILVSAVALGYVGLSSGLTHKLTRDSLYNETTSSALMLHKLRSFYDEDGDGVARGLGEFDCDDTNPKIHPGAFDTPGNDIDEDCDGHDLSVITLQTITPAVESNRPIEARRDMAQVAKQGVIRAETIKRREEEIKIIEPLFERIKGPHSVILITLPGLTSEAIEPRIVKDKRSRRAANKKRRSTKRDSARDTQGAEVKEQPISLTPALHQLAQRSLWAREAYAPAPDTAFSLLSLFTGRYPSELIRDNRTPVTLSRAMYTLPEVLGRSKYQSFAFVSDEKIKPQRGLKQGFKRWDRVESPKRRRRRDNSGGALSKLVQRTLEHIKSAPLGQREFELLWLHSDELLRELKPLGEMPARRRNKTIKQNRERYLSALGRIDIAIAQLNEALATSTLAQRNYTVVISGLHGYSFEGEERSKLSESWLKSTLIIHSPEVKARVLATPIQLLSLTPTLLDFAEIERFDAARNLMRMRVNSIASEALGDSLEASEMYAEYMNSKNELAGRVWRQYQWKLYQGLRSRGAVTQERLYELNRFGEDQDRRPIEETRYQIMREDLETFEDRELRSVSAFPKLGR